MPYKSGKDLPKAVQGVLPPDAQQVFVKAFNNGYEKSGEERSFKRAWSAVKRGYEKNEQSGKWEKKKK
jgi:cation transport regulator